MRGPSTSISQKPKNKKIQQLTIPQSPSKINQKPSIPVPYILSQQQQLNSHNCFLMPKIIKKQFRNSTYIGSTISIKNPKKRNSTNNTAHSVKQGLGLLISDDNELIFGNWQDDVLCGQCVYISNQLRFFGKIDTNGVFEGFHMIKVMNWNTNNDSSLNQNQISISGSKLSQVQYLRQKQRKLTNQVNANVDMTQYRTFNSHTSRITTGNRDMDKVNKQAQLQPMTLFAIFKNNKIFGKCVIVVKQDIYICSLRVTEGDSNTLNANVNVNVSNTTNMKMNQLMKSYRQKQFSNINNKINSQSANMHHQQPSNNSTFPKQFLQIQDKIKNSNRNQLPNILNHIFPYIKVFELEEYLRNMIDVANLSSHPVADCNTDQIPIAMIVGNQDSLPAKNNRKEYGINLSKYVPVVRKYPIKQPINHRTTTNDYKVFYGFSTHGSNQAQPNSYINQLPYMHNKKNLDYEFGFILYNQQLLSMGEHVQGVPHGMATVYQYPYYIHDGIFRYGVPDGLGVRLDFRLGNKFVYGKFVSNDISIGKDKNQSNSRYYNINDFRLDNNYSTIKPSISSTQTPTKKYKSIILSQHKVLQNVGSSNKSLNSEDLVQRIQEGKNWPSAIVKKFKRQLHLKSVTFDHGYAQIRVAVPIQQLYMICRSIVDHGVLVPLSYEYRHTHSYDKQKTEVGRQSKTNRFSKMVGNNSSGDHNILSKNGQDARISIFSNKKQKSQTKRRYTQASPSYSSKQKQGETITQFKSANSNGNEGSNWRQGKNRGNEEQMRQRMKTNPNVVTGSTNLHYMGNRNSHNSTLDTGNLHSNHDDDKDNGERKEYSNRNRQSRFKSNTIAVLNNKQQNTSNYSSVLYNPTTPFKLGQLPRQHITYDNVRDAQSPNSRQTIRAFGIKRGIPTHVNDGSHNYRSREGQHGISKPGKSNRKKLNIKVQEQQARQEQEQETSKNINITVKNANINMIMVHPHQISHTHSDIHRSSSQDQYYK